MRAWLVCIDELTVLAEIFSKKSEIFRRPKQDCETFEQEYNDAKKPLDNLNGEIPIERIAFAERMMEESTKQCKRLNADLQESMNSVEYPSGISCL